MLSIEILSIGEIDTMISVRQVKAARALLGWSQADLAAASGVSGPTIARLESSIGDALGGRPSTTDKIVEALQRAGIEFTNGGTPGVRLHKQKTKSARKK
jgi:transcriptional regulator with XRE-family HTH domain